MSTDLNKKFDPIPILPPGIAPPLPKASEPAPSQTAPPLPTKSSPSKSEAKTESKKETAKKAPVPTWLQGVFAPSKNKGVVAVAAASLLAGWYGVRTIFPPAPMVETVAEVTTEPPPELPDATTQSLIEAPVASTSTAPADNGFLPRINLPEVKLEPSTLPVPAVDPKVLAGNPTPSAPVPVPDLSVPAPSPIIPVTHNEIQLPAIPSATGTPAPASPPTVALPEIKPPAAATPGTIVPASGPVSGPGMTIPIVPHLTPPPVGNEKKPDPTPAPVLAIPSLPDATGTPATSTAPPTATPPATTPSISLPPVASPTVGGTSLVVPDVGVSRPAPTTTPPVVSLPDINVPSVSTTPPPAAATTTPPSAVVPSSPPAIIPISPQVRPDPVVVPTSGSPVSTAPLSTEKPVTDFDVDLHYPKANESYASIARQHYGDEKYGSILAQFNQANNAGNTRVIQVPPVWWVKKQSGAPAVRPANNETPKPENWSPAAATAGYRFYTIPATATAGMTFREIAKQAYGTDQEWQRVFDLNQTYPSDATLPAGTRVRLTADAKVGQ
jgi:hypothetical protein